jgi:ParB family chromosome partitioning protein
MNGRYLKKSIVYLNRSQLEPHPDNPRKDLGDLEELRESIRENGIMQNLTVIPTDDTLEHFRILIGHRRFAASEGIENELPCVIVKGLSDKEQLSIMLCENMQRSDLTFIEKAHGFQLMLDLGDTVEEIAHKTGFSETTVKHRLKINELDQNSISEASEYFQLSISDFITLEKVKDIEERNRILADARNSSELAETVQDYLEELEHNKKVAEIEEVMTEIGWKKSENYLNVYSNGWSSVAKWTDNIEIDKFDNETAKKLRALAQKEKGAIYYRISWRYLEIARKEAKKKDENKRRRRKSCAGKRWTRRASCSRSPAAIYATNILISLRTWSIPI